VKPRARQHFKNQPSTKPTIKQKPTKQKNQKITPEQLATIVKNFASVSGACIDSMGGHFEHLLK
jgi:hypothetical protein